ncbi:hypothetical protein ACIRL0_13955 [Streptomyces sp. NPDC102365]
MIMRIGPALFEPARRTRTMPHEVHVAALPVLLAAYTAPVVLRWMW